mmetsp:Transcript_50214/g.133357  ORF Transcript_50214/g.133357 Transcript_50214/m.133357 type:complete len:205 (-) Transcript_50214:729-1343(-)
MILPRHRACHRMAASLVARCSTPSCGLISFNGSARHRLLRRWAVLAKKKWPLVWSFDSLRRGRGRERASGSRETFSRCSCLLESGLEREESVCRSLWESLVLSSARRMGGPLELLLLAQGIGGSLPRMVARWRCGCVTGTLWRCLVVLRADGHPTSDQATSWLFPTRRKLNASVLGSSSVVVIWLCSALPMSKRRHLWRLTSRM